MTKTEIPTNKKPKKEQKKILELKYSGNEKFNRGIHKQIRAGKKQSSVHLKIEQWKLLALRIIKKKRLK
jgi:predicted DsbA family dithiol-disulfide isomerase